MLTGLFQLYIDMKIMILINLIYVHNHGPQHS
jgi:hypothetical protein